MSQRNITIPEWTSISELKQQLNIPRGATYFRMSFSEGSKAIIEKINNLDVVRGCSGKIEFGKVERTGVGRNSRIVAFTPLDSTSDSTEETTPATSEPDAPASEPEVTAKPASKRGKHGDILGYSACAVLKSLGQAGVKIAEASAILEAHGISMPKPSISVQLGFGRNESNWARHGKPAPLSQEQLDSLRRMVPSQAQ